MSSSSSSIAVASASVSAALSNSTSDFPLYGLSPFNSTSPPGGQTPMCSSTSNRTTEACCDELAGGGGRVYSSSFYSGATKMEGACLLPNSSNASAWAECVQRTGLIPAQGSERQKAGATSSGCTTYDDRVAELQRAAGERQFHLSYVSGGSDSVPEDERVVYSTIDTLDSLNHLCCEKAGDEGYWHRFGDLSDSLAAQVCIFQKKEAEEKKIFDNFWSPCIRNFGAYPAVLNNVTGSSAGYANRASAGIVLAAAALAMLA